MSRTYSFARELTKPDSPVAQFFKQRFPNTQAVAQDFRRQTEHLPTIRPDVSIGEPPYDRLGTAIDYRLQYYFRPGIIQTTDAFKGARYIGSSPGLGESVQVPAYGPQVMKDWNGTASVCIPRLAQEFFDSLGALVQQLHPMRRILPPDDELRLSHYCFILGLFEQGPRRLSGRPRTSSLLDRLSPGATLNDLLGLAHPEWVKDIGRMAWLFGKRYSSLFYGRVRVSPRYTSQVGGFGGAADLLINGYLIDIKAALQPALSATWLYQVLGYTLLDFGDSLKIEGVGFYLARQGVFVQWALDELLPQLTFPQSASLEELRRDFYETVLSKLNYRD